MPQYKNIQFDLLRPYFLEKNADGNYTEYHYDLSPLFKVISEKPLSTTKHKIWGDNHLFHKCQYSENRKVWELQILHLREQILPGIADGNGVYELIQLEDDQYPAESTTIVYSEEKRILYFQRNIYGTSIKAFTTLIQLLSPNDVMIVLKPIMKAEVIKKLGKQKLYKKIQLAVDSEQLSEYEEDSRLAKIINTFSSYGGKIVTLKLGFGRKRKKWLNSADAFELLKEAYDFVGTQKLIVSVSENEDTKVNEIDLLDDREKFMLQVSYSREYPITHGRLFQECLQKI